MYLSLSVPSDRIDVFRAAAAALLAAAAIISLILLISPVQELEAEINSFRLSGGGPAARSSAGSAADPTPTASPTVAALAAPVLTAQAAEDGVELSWTTVHGATRYELFVWDSVNEWRQIGGDSLTGTTYTHTDLVAGTTYFYTILAVNADGETSALSDHVSTTVTATATATPTHDSCPRPHPLLRLQATVGHPRYAYTLVWDTTTGVTPHRLNLNTDPRRRHHLFLHHPCSQRRRRNKPWSDQVCHGPLLRLRRHGRHRPPHRTPRPPTPTRQLGLPPLLRRC